MVKDMRGWDLYHWGSRSVGMPLLRLMDPERAHDVAIELARRGLAPLDLDADNEVLSTTVWGVTFPNPVGIAAGFDKHAQAMTALVDCGFGFVEVGSVTPLPQPGNPKPRMFRLAEDRAVINRYGFNSDGLVAVLARIVAWRESPTPGCVLDGARPPRTTPSILGVNVGKNKTAAAQPDYIRGVTAFAPHADYLVVNISSPNTPGLRSLQRREDLQGLVTAVLAARNAQSPDSRPPLLIKIAPDLTPEEVRDIAAVALETGVDGIIVSNTTVARSAALRSPHRGETGGLSGAPLKDMALRRLREVYLATEGRIPLVGVGGIESGKDAYARIRAGASLVQVYSSLVYGGPSLAREIKRDLAGLLLRDGFAHVSEAVGVDARV